MLHDPLLQDQKDVKLTREDFTYQIVRVKGFLNTAQDKRYDLSGDHLTVAELSTGAALYLKLGTRRNPWIRLREGDTFVRGFDRFWLRAADFADVAGSTGVNVSAILYVSHGEFYRRTAPPHGVNRNFWAGPGVCPIVADYLKNTLTGGPVLPFTSSKIGQGVLYITNRAAAGGESIYISYATGLAGGVGPGPANFPNGTGHCILPQTSFRMELAGNALYDQDTPEGIAIATAGAGTAAFTLLLSPNEHDPTDSQLGGVGFGRSLALTDLTG